ncbi:hypothetical protein PSH79_02720 [Pseudomonas sp. FP2196]|uniref:hypothetical protein n=1 Tax=Pseudomonas sp. FP2196 TaxID=2954086 RepID=UPI002733F20B|nr:hypothetical protein [Pseudomonas sp. FP2196]WLH36220.1 hypothetical protein PSH79_02720 [Pseudomonas sp. FP2196]
MSPKLPFKGTLAVDIHTRPGVPAVGPAARRDTLTSVDPQSAICNGDTDTTSIAARHTHR